MQAGWRVWNTSIELRFLHAGLWVRAEVVKREKAKYNYVVKYRWLIWLPEIYLKAH